MDDLATITAVENIYTRSHLYRRGSTERGESTGKKYE
jgi:hypothetical protein